MHGKTRQIIELYAAGHGHAEIARIVGCTTSNVTQTVNRHARWDHRIAALPLEHQQWLIQQGKLNRQSPARVAANLLQHTIEFYMRQET